MSEATSQASSQVELAGVLHATGSKYHSILSLGPKDRV
jgi:hypothetical protein